MKVMGTIPTFKTLRTLDLQDCRLGDEGIAALVQSRGLPNLESLALQSNQLTAASYETLFKAKHFPKLRRINLHYNAAIPADTLARLKQRYQIIADNG
jgi:Ran GTPase-activating protein (RanGAP) involved in mRNA processing and transport